MDNFTLEDEALISDRNSSDRILSKIDTMMVMRTKSFIIYSYTMWGQSGVVVSTLDFRSEGRWFEAQSLPLCCFLRQETLPHIGSLHPGV